MENYKHFEMKDKYREETNTDVYADEDVLTSKPTGSFSNKYVSWLEKIAWEGMNKDKSSANCAIFDVSKMLPTDKHVDEYIEDDLSKSDLIESLTKREGQIAKAGMRAGIKYYREWIRGNFANVTQV